MKKMILVILVLTAVCAAGPLAMADVVVTDGGTTTTTTVNHWRSADTPIGTLFHLVGDVVAFPFRLLGDLF
jgi:hypothetical protein